MEVAEGRRQLETREDVILEVRAGLRRAGDGGGQQVRVEPTRD